MPGTFGTSTVVLIPGSAVNQAGLAKPSVGTPELFDANVTLAKLAANSVDASKIQDASVGLAELAPNSVDATKIVDLAVGTAELADLAVTLAKLAANSVDASKIIDGSVNNAEVNAAAGIVSSKLAGYGMYPLDRQNIGAVATLTVSPIPQTYRSLLVVLSHAKSSRAATQDSVCLRFNNDATANYNTCLITLATAYAYTSSAAATLWNACSAPGSSGPAPGSTADLYILIPNYTDATSQRNAIALSFTQDAGTNLPIVQLSAARFQTAGALTRLDVLWGTGPNFVAGVGGQITTYGLE